MAASGRRNFPRDKNLRWEMSTLEAIADVDAETQQAISDWHYWVNRGYQLC
ncbi:MAG: hypothetical protein O3C67_10865 [Cyanobacteria bacterium]|nr:hypothetical protein [Cyanobacteriota bacterium]